MNKRQTLTESMATIGNVINGALINPEILAALVPFGYSESRIRREGLTQYQAVEALFIAQQKEYGEQYTATEEMNKRWDEVYATYMKILRLSRIALKNHPGALHSLRATGSRNRSVSGFIKDARTLCHNLTDQPSWLALIRQFGIGASDLSGLLQQVDSVEASYHSFLKEKGEAQEATVARDAAFDALYDWYSDFRAVARIALADHPQLLEKQGIVMKR